MENPLTWNSVQIAISDAIREHDTDTLTEICGFTLVTVIYNKLKDCGYLNLDYEVESSKKF